MWKNKYIEGNKLNETTFLKIMSGIPDLISIHDKDGECDMFIELVKNITIRKQNEIELKKHKENLEELVKEKTDNLETINNILIDINNELGIDKSINIVESLNEFSSSNTIYDEICDIHSIIDNCVLIVQNKLEQNIFIRKKYDKNEIITKATDKGTGLGLSISSNIIKEHNGILKFNSEKNKGTTVSIIINNKQE